VAQALVGEVMRRRALAVGLVLGAELTVAVALPAAAAGEPPADDPAALLFSPAAVVEVRDREIDLS
jgi:hypothetical protein